MFPFEINDKGAQISIYAGKAKVDLNVDFQSKLDAALMLSPFRIAGNPLPQIIGSLCIKHPNLFGRSKRLDVTWGQLTQMPIHSISPEIGIHALPVDNFSYSESGGVNLSRFSVGIDLDESASSNWTNKTSAMLEHVSPINDDVRSISRDLDGFLVTDRLMGGSSVGDIAPYQAFAIGGIGSVRGYGEGAVGTGALGYAYYPMVKGAIFLDFGTGLYSGRHVPGNL